MTEISTQARLHRFTLEVFVNNGVPRLHVVQKQARAVWENSTVMTELATPHASSFLTKGSKTMASS